MEAKRITSALSVYNLVSTKLSDGNAALGDGKKELLAIIVIGRGNKVKYVVYTKADIRTVEGMSVAIHYAQEAYKDEEVVGVALAMETQSPWPSDEIKLCVAEYRKALNLLQLLLIDVVLISDINFFSFADERTHEI